MVSKQEELVAAFYTATIGGSALFLIIYTILEFFEKRKTDPYFETARQMEFMKKNLPLIEEFKSEPGTFLFRLVFWPTTLTAIGIYFIFSTFDKPQDFLLKHLLGNALLIAGLVAFCRRIHAKRDIIFLPNKNIKIKEFIVLKTKQEDAEKAEKEKKENEKEEKDKREKLHMEKEEKARKRERELQLIAKEVERQRRQKEESFWRNLDGHSFEREVSFLLRTIGFKKANKTRGSNDRGIDILAEDQHGKTVVVQCKAHNKKVSPAIIREFFGAFQALKISESQGYALLVTINGASNEAGAFAKDNGIQIWNVRDLVKLSKKLPPNEI